MGQNQSIITDKGPAQGGFLMSRQIEVLELVGGCEAKNRYHIRYLDKQTAKDCMDNSDKLPSRANTHGKTAPYDLYGMERSACCERICCGPNRSLNIDISMADHKAEPFLVIDKPFGCVDCCFLKTQTTMKTVPAAGAGQGQSLAHAQIGWPACCPCSGCSIDVHGDNTQGGSQFNTKSKACLSCTPAFCCPCCCGPYHIPIVRKGETTPVATVTRPQLTCMQVCGKSNELMVTWADASLSEADKMVIINMMYTMEFEYFSPRYGAEKGDN